MKVVNCQIVSLEPLTQYVYKAILKPAEKVNFLPGQYLNLMLNEDDKRPFSIASSPSNELIELQIGAFGEESYASQVIEALQSRETIQIEIAAGKAYLQEESERPLLLIAGGTGFSYIKSIFEYLAETNTKRSVTVYWGLRDPSACYELVKTQTTLQAIADSSFYPVVENIDDAWPHKVGMVHRVVMQDIKNLADYDIYLAGRFDMVGAVRKDFIAQGALVDHMYADAFAFI